jgi:hypothetical protein
LLVREDEDGASGTLKRSAQDVERLMGCPGEYILAIDGRPTSEMVNGRRQGREVGRWRGRSKSWIAVNASSIF